MVYKSFLSVLIYGEAKQNIDFNDHFYLMCLFASSIFVVYVPEKYTPEISIL